MLSSTSIIMYRGICNLFSRNKCKPNPICCLHSWSHLSKVFNKKPVIKKEKHEQNTGLFDVPDLQSSEGFLVLKDRCVTDTDKLMDEAVSEGRTRKMVEIFDELSDTLCKVADLSEFLRIAHPSAVYGRAAENTCVAVSGIVEKLNTNRNLYFALSNIIKTGDIQPTTEIDDHVARLFQFDFEQSGIHLPELDRHKVVISNDIILNLGQQFMAGSSNPRSIKKSMLPATMQHLFYSQGDNIIVSGLNADATNPITRELAYRIYLYPDEHQEMLLSELLQARHELACICGFKTYANRALKGSLFESPKTVLEFLGHLSKQLKSRAEEDFAVMSNMKKSDTPHYPSLSVWDVPFYTQKIKKDVFHVCSSEYSAYFSLGACMEGLNTLLKSLYGIQFENVEMVSGESWSSDVYKLGVVHEHEGLLGYIYCDFYERSGKPNQDCHFTIRGGKQLSDGSYQLPVVVLMLNLPSPHWGRPSLLSPGMVDNLFHEMGHAMHSMLGRTSYQHVTGTRCSTDFAEVPSVLMEYFAADPRVLRTFARHFQTNELIPQDMLERLCASKHLFTASEMQIQVFYSTLDQIYHNEHPLKGSTTDVLAEVQKQFYSLPYVNNTAWQLRFSHLVGYGAKYYSYLVSRALAFWIWQSYFEADPLNRTQGERYRRECLAHGGGKPPYQLIADFLQREPTPTVLADSLINEIDSKREKVKQISQIYTV